MDLTTSSFGGPTGTFPHTKFMQNRSKRGRFQGVGEGETVRQWISETMSMSMSYTLLNKKVLRGTSGRTAPGHRPISGANEVLMYVRFRYVAPFRNRAGVKSKIIETNVFPSVKITGGRRNVNTLCGRFHCTF